MRDLPNDGKHIDAVIATTTCTKHNVVQGEACWSIHYSDFPIPGSAVCNSRAKRAGFNAPIHPSSLSVRDRPATRGNPANARKRLTANAA